MGRFIGFILFLCGLLLLVHPTVSLPLCSDSTAPSTLNSTLEFCPYKGSVCCNSTQDGDIQRQFQGMNISDPACSSLVKSIVCARCDPFSGDLYIVNSTPRSVPLLCNSTSENSPQSNQAATDFCSTVWDTCQNITIVNSPFAPSLQGRAGVPTNSSTSKLSDLWLSKTDFCNAFGGSSTEESVCFVGEPVSLNNTKLPSPPDGLCLEKIGNGSYLNMVAHPDGSNRAFFSNQAGKVWLATIPEMGSGGMLELDESKPFVDLTDVVNLDTQFGMMGLAFHPNFAQNGRFFASFNCDKVKWPGCSGRCSCNSDVNCDPSKLPSDSGSQPCQHQSVVAEYTVNGSASQPSLATTAKPTEVRRIITIGLPFTSRHAGQILFGEDGYLYFMMGDGGGQGGDPYNFSQNKKSLLGKIMRLDINNIPSSEDINKLDLWGNYSIPKDNPFVEDQSALPEIWAYGLRNPWRCSFDSERPSYFMCGDVGQDRFEEVNIISKGGNYGWSVYEGPLLFVPNSSPKESTPIDSINPIFPVMGYNHSTINKNTGSASITGGYFYRSNTDPCLYGRYLYADLYASAIWAGTETPKNSGNFTTNDIPFSCAPDSPIPCSSTPGSPLPALGYVFSFGEDNDKDIYVLTSSGVYRFVPPSRCKYTCSLENVTTTVGSLSPTPSPPSHASRSTNSWSSLVLLLLLLFTCS
ncbi:HIPL1 protein-like [Cucurbita maxima]|uniref:HIPL1 protein-like n=1 Tax=Cucurbita maxima TaxID=3661 RepID=A0A6J1K386_CUCMA|nr:HIPL1 protein-like [Cucurbita maxima]